MPPFSHGSVLSRPPLACSCLALLPRFRTTEEDRKRKSSNQLQALDVQCPCSPASCSEPVQTPRPLEIVTREGVLQELRVRSSSGRSPSEAPDLFTHRETWLPCSTLASQESYASKKTLVGSLAQRSNMAAAAAAAAALRKSSHPSQGSGEQQGWPPIKHPQCLQSWSGWQES